VHPPLDHRWASKSQYATSYHGGSRGRGFVVAGARRQRDEHCSAARRSERSSPRLPYRPASPLAGHVARLGKTRATSECRRSSVTGRSSPRARSACRHDVHGVDGECLRARQARARAWGRPCRRSGGEFHEPFKRREVPARRHELGQQSTNNVAPGKFDRVEFALPQWMQDGLNGTSYADLVPIQRFRIRENRPFRPPVRPQP